MKARARDIVPSVVYGLAHQVLSENNYMYATRILPDGSLCKVCFGSSLRYFSSYIGTYSQQINAVEV